MATQLRGEDLKPLSPVRAGDRRHDEDGSIEQSEVAYLRDLPAHGWGIPNAQHDELRVAEHLLDRALPLVIFVIPPEGADRRDAFARLSDGHDRAERLRRCYEQVLVTMPMLQGQAVNDPATISARADLQTVVLKGPKEDDLILA